MTAANLTSVRVASSSASKMAPSSVSDIVNLLRLEAIERVGSGDRANFADAFSPGISNRTAAELLEAGWQPRRERIEVLEQPDHGRELRPLGAVLDLDDEADSL